MYTPKVAVLFGFGINCDHETAAVFEMVGGKSSRVHLNAFSQDWMNYLTMISSQSQEAFLSVTI